MRHVSCRFGCVYGKNQTVGGRPVHSRLNSSMTCPRRDGTECHAFPMTWRIRMEVLVRRVGPTPDQDVAVDAGAAPAVPGSTMPLLAAMQHFGGNRAMTALLTGSSSSINSRPSGLMVPEAGVEPAWACKPWGF